MIIDTHVHTGFFVSPEKVVDMSEEVVLESLKKHNIDFALVSNSAEEVDCLLQPIPKERQKTQEQAFLEAINFARNNMDKIEKLHFFNKKEASIKSEKVAFFNKRHFSLIFFCN